MKTVALIVVVALGQIPLPSLVDRQQVCDNAALLEQWRFFLIGQIVRAGIEDTNRHNLASLQQELATVQFWEKINTSLDHLHYPATYPEAVRDLDVWVGPAWREGYMPLPPFLLKRPSQTP